MQIQAPAVLSSQFQSVSTIQFVSVNGQVASSHPRTACACQFTFVFGQAASSHPRNSLYPYLCYQPSNQFKYKNSLCFLFFLFSQVTSSNTRAACALSTCQYSRSSSQFEPKEQLAPVNLLLSLPSESCYSVNVYQSRNGYDILRFCYSVNVYQSRNGYDIFC